MMSARDLIEAVANGQDPIDVVNEESLVEQCLIHTSYGPGYWFKQEKEFAYLGKLGPKPTRAQLTKALKAIAKDGYDRDVKDAEKWLERKKKDDPGRGADYKWAEKLYKEAVKNKPKSPQLLHMWKKDDGVVAIGLSGSRDQSLGSQVIVFACGSLKGAMSAVKRDGKIYNRREVRGHANNIDQIKGLTRVV
jgi:hypothetical protein